MIEQRDEKRFLKALDIEPGSAPARGSASPWPEAVARDPFAFDDPVEPQWLDDENIDDYLAFLRRTGQSNRTAPPSVCGLPRDWRAASYPLLLSEFLAYKAALVYREPKIIRADLLGASPRTGEAFCEGITTAAFFDSAGRHTTRAPQSQRSHGTTRRPRTATFLRPPSVQYGDTQALAFAANGTGYIVLRGTESFVDLGASLNDVLTDKTYATLADVPQSLVGAPRPARRTGYAIAWGAIAMDLEAWVREQMQAGRIERLVLSGHSLGGALAILGAYHFAKDRICPVHAVITFGAPKVGGEEFKQAYENPVLGLKDRTLRLEAADDLVTLLDRRFDGLVHVGHVWRLTKRPLRPWWQMMIWASLIDPAESAQRKAAKARAKKAGPANRPDQKSEDNKSAATRGHNRPAETVERSWRGFALSLALKLAWFMTRHTARAWSAHSVESNYGLYLSALSYRKIRAHHAALARLRLMTRRSFERENVLMEKAFRGANTDFSSHLRFMRGRHPKTFRSLAKRPIRVHSPTEVKRLEKKFGHYIV